MKNILITGGAGFIGSNLTVALVKYGYNVTILDNLSDQVHGDLSSSISYNKIKDISVFIRGDVRNKTDWEKAIKNQDVVVHLASETGTGQSMYEIQRYTNVNILGTSHLLDILINQKNNIQKIILASSRAIYGEGKYKCGRKGVVYPPLRREQHMISGNYNIFLEKDNKVLEPLPTDEASKIQPSSIYGITKQQQEQMIMLIGKTLNIPVVALRYQNVYGPGQSLLNPYTGILSIFSTRILNQNNLDIYEDGKQTRDFVYIDDVVKATILALENEKANNEVFNVGSGMPISVFEVAKILKDLYKSSIEINISGKFRFGDIRHNYADLTKINKILGFTPEVDFISGISKFVDWVGKQDLQQDRYDESLMKLSEKGLIQ